MPTPPAIAETRIMQASHRRFGAFSGDLNPIHADPEAARTMQPGALLAYGMDMVLWALESLAVAKRLPASPARLRARFVKWVYLEDHVTLRAGQASRDELHNFEFLVSEAPVAMLELFSGERQATPPLPATETAPLRLREPRALGLEELEGREGCAAVPTAGEAASLFPVLAQALGAPTIAELAACSYVIGMEAPGLYSMSMRYDLHLIAADRERESTGLHYRVVSVDARFRKAKIAVTGAHIAGTLEAFVRPS